MQQDVVRGSYHFSPDGLRLISKCPICQEHYRPFQASIVAEQPEAQLVHITCTKCRSGVVALIMNGQLGLSSVGVITDLNSQDVERFKEAKPITEHQVLEAYQEFTNNFEQSLINMKL